MFPDSQIAKSFHQAETKTKYIIQFGVAPYIRKQVIEDFTGHPFTFKFDETARFTMKKQYDGYVQFWSLSKNIIVNRFALFQLSTSTMGSIYFSLFHLYLYYGLSLWGFSAKSEFHKIVLIQNNMIKVICRASKFDSCGKLYKKLNLLKLKDLFFMKIVYSMWNFGGF